jgi:Cu2+-containing amine oxidase
MQSSLRKDFKPICISQPYGVSFSITPEDLEVVSWQKWRFRLTFNYREGPVLRDVRYDGRPVFYRLALAEMTVPYGDPRSPYHRKSAYDLGECGAGATANNLALGCDCLGVIKYFDGWINNEKGEPVKMQNAICMHEVDAGIGWKHTNFRNGHSEITRARELIIQTIMTIANYEYILCWVFDTAGSIYFETRATGIMSVVPMKQGVEHNLPYGIMVAPGVMAPSHQHIFSLRIDPAIDGYRNSAIQYEETLPIEPHPVLNPFGVAYEVRSHPITRSSYLDLDVSSNRTVKLINDRIINPICGKPVAYKIVMPATQLQLAHQTSMHYKRGEFADHHFYFTPQNEDELYPGSDHPWQSSGGGGVRTWAARQEKLGNKGVVWCQFGFTHNPRLEDWPVMPCEVYPSCDLLLTSGFPSSFKTYKFLYSKSSSRCPCIDSKI